MSRLALSFFVFTFPAAQAADPLPLACTPQRSGQVTCVENRLCECRHDPGGSMLGRAEGWRWDCGILRPECRPAPAGSGPAQSLPPGLLMQLPPGVQQQLQPQAPPKAAWRN